MKFLATKRNAREWPVRNGVTLADGLYYSIKAVDVPRALVPFQRSLQKAIILEGED